MGTGRVFALSVCSIFALFVVCFAFFVNAGLAAEVNQRRVALVIGNSHYQHLVELQNPAHDAEAVSKRLKHAGFEVIEGRDLNKIGVEGAIRGFFRELNKNDIALFYYSGHAVEVGGVNYLLPVDATLASPDDLEVEAISITSIIDILKQRAGLQLVFLDACRDNPFDAQNFAVADQVLTPSRGTGLARIAPAMGTLVAFATEPGQVAFDGEGQISPFSAAFAANVEKPGLEVRQMLTRMRRDVIDVTGGKQVPWELSMLLNDFFFVGDDRSFQPVLHKSVVPRGRQNAPLFLPPLAGDDGGGATVRLLSVVPSGQLSIDGSVIQPNQTFDARDLTKLAYSPPTGARPDVAVASYLISSSGGRSMTDVVTIDVTDDPAKIADFDTRLAQLDAGKIDKTAQLLDGKSFNVEIGVGYQPLLPKSAKTSEVLWVTVQSVDDAVSLAVGDKVLKSGDGFSFADIQNLMVRPAIGSENVDARVKLAVPAFGPGASRSISFSVRPKLDTCDAEAGQPLDPQGVVAGRLPNEINVEAARAACAVAVGQYPQVARFVFESARVELANGNLDRARKLLQEAHDKGHIRAAHMLAMIYIGGFGVPVDKDKGMALLRDGATYGDPYAMQSLGFRLATGDDATKKRDGLNLLVRAVEAGHTYAYNALGSIYQRGEYVAKDVQRAKLFFEQSADRHDIYGYFNLATIYRDGEAGPHNYAGAMQWFLKAHEGGHPDAASAIGFLYASGLGVKKDPVQALSWYRQSAARGSIAGNYNVGITLADEGRSNDERAEAATCLALSALLAEGPRRTRAEDALNKLPTQIRLLATQRLLNEAGFDIGEPDGKKGAKTDAAIAAFAQTANLQITDADAALTALVKRKFERGKPRIDLF